MTSHQSDSASSTQQQSSVPITLLSNSNDKSLGNVLAGSYKKDPVSEQIDKEGVRAFGDDTYVSTEEDQKNTWTNLFSAQKIVTLLSFQSEYKQIWTTHRAQWKSIDSQLAENITRFKEENIMSVGDIRIRSVLMAFSSAVLYKCISWNTVGFLRKSRNMGISFVLTGYWFVPELFNPFLKKQKIAHTL